MAEGVENILELIKSIPAGRKISFLVVLCLVIGGFTALMMYANRPDFQVLFSNLDTSDAARISERLRENRTPFQLRDGGRAILVPSDVVYQLRLDMASEGIPRGSSVGFEIFDNMSFGTTEFVQKMRFQQAIQGELARTIMEFDAIAQARVHIVPAGDSLFAEPEKTASASVVIRQNPGMSLTERHLQGIVNLVTCSVEGLKPENVTVVDMAGGMLLKGSNGDSVNDLTRNQFEYRRNLEKNYEKQIETLLQPVVGRNNVVARVSADVDLRRVSISEEIYDPDSAVIRSEQRQTESSTEGDRIPSGSPDLQYQVYQSDDMNTMSSSANVYQRENSVINYEINRTNRQVMDTSGDVRRLTAAVIIDGPYVTATDEQGNQIREFVPRDRREMRTFEDIVKQAIGFNEGRGDQVTVTNVAFDLQSDAMTAPMPAMDTDGWLDYLKRGTRPLTNIFLVLLFFFVAVKPFKKWLSQTSEYVSTRALPSGVQLDEIENETRGELQARQSSKLKLLEATKENPDVAADIIKTWLNEVS